MAKQNEALKEVTITRLLDAPQQRVWRAWTDPKQVEKWWGPRGFTIPVCEIDLRKGGRMLLHESGFGIIAPLVAVYKEIVEPEKLVFTTAAYADVELKHLLLDGITSVTMVPEGGKTRLTIQTAILKAAPEAAQALDGTEQGWNEQTDKLEEFLK